MDGGGEERRGAYACVIGHRVAGTENPLMVGTLDPEFISGRLREGAAALARNIALPCLALPCLALPRLPDTRGWAGLERKEG